MKIIKSNKKSEKDSTGVKAGALYTADLGSIPSNTYGLASSTRCDF